MREVEGSHPNPGGWHEEAHLQMSVRCTDRQKGAQMASGCADGIANRYTHGWRAMGMDRWTRSWVEGYMYA